MKLDKPVNSGYAATVVKLKKFVDLPGCDNVRGTPIFGYQAIVGKGHYEGELGIVFPAETQLSDQFCFENNLYRHSNQNKNIAEKGYMEDNRRVKAMKFRGQSSNCLFMPLSSLEYTGINVNFLEEGDEFDTINGKEICKKYVVRTNNPREARVQPKRFSRVDSRHMPEHIDTLNFFKFLDTLNPEQDIIVTQKLHGTSIRIGHTIVLRKLNIMEKFLKKLGVNVEQFEYDYVYGSRKVIKDANNPDQKHYYDSDLWSEQGSKLKGMLPKNYLVYGELVGWTSDGKEIQKNYTYSVPKGTSELFIYRIATINPDGNLTDLSWEQVKQFCQVNGLQHVPELWKGKIKDFPIDEFLNVRYFDKYRHAVCLGDNLELVDEGVCVRMEGIIPRILKAKCSKFFEHETSLLNTGEEDLESTQS